MAETAGLVFGVIIAIIVIIFLLVFGMPQIMNVFSLGGQSRAIQIVNNIERVAGDTWSLAVGSTRLLEVNIPSGTRICFVNSENPASQIYDTSLQWKWWTPDTQVIQQMLSNPNSEYYQSNIWVYWSEQDTIGEGKQISHLMPKDGLSFCVTGVRELFFERQYLRTERLHVVEVSI